MIMHINGTNVLFAGFVGVITRKDLERGGYSPGAIGDVQIHAEL